MWLLGKHFDSKLRKRIRTVIAKESDLSRTELSRRVCEWLNWRGSNGALLEGSGRKALRVLEERGEIELPPSRRRPSPGRTTPATAARRVAIVRFRGPLEKLGTVNLVAVDDQHDVLYPVWKTLLERHHPLGSGPLIGARLRYLVRCERPGYLGALAFSAAPLHLKDRDQWIGWSAKVRRANIHKVIQNSRFVILPSVDVPNLASHVLAMAARQVVIDWQQRYGVRPGLLETFVDPRCFHGTCYRAANFKPLGRTAARSGAFANGAVAGGAKLVFALPLLRSWRRYLCQWQRPGLLELPGAAAGADWVQMEFSRVDVYDSRLKRRIYQVVRDFYANPGALVPEACGGEQAKTKAAYRLMSNTALDLETLLRSHVGESISRIREHRVVIAAQDTTTVNYGPGRHAKGLGPINNIGNQAVGLLVHDMVAFSEQGTPLGVLQADAWARDFEEQGKSTERATRPIEDKESYKWLRGYQTCVEVHRHCPETRLVVVGDRESDLYELFEQAGRQEDGPDLLVRAEKSRQRKVDGVYLWDCLAREAEAGRIEIEVPRHGKQAARQATLAIRWRAVELTPPKKSPRRQELSPRRLVAVYVTEVDPPPNVKEPLEWMLLSTVDVGDFDDAARLVSWYCLRWNIEIFHRILKSGCRIEDRQLDSREALQTALGIDLVVAWRIFYLTKLGREVPQAPCTLVLEEDEWRALMWHATRKPPSETPITLAEAIRRIAKLGGFLGRKSDGQPGPTVIWRGLRRLYDFTEMYRAMTEGVRDGPNTRVTSG